MADYEKTFNMFMGTSNKELDWFDNPYITPVVYDITDKWKPVESNIKLRKCDREKDQENFMAKNVAAYYPNAICFEDKSDV